nr:matrix-remodeling-associated protein 7-like isoform X1 [Procambarus clarkii]
MAAMSGYINSQTWEVSAWFETYEVSWENTSLIFVLTVALSLAVVITTWMMRDSGYDTNHGHQDQCEIAELQGIQEVNTDEESEQERNDESIEKLLEISGPLPGEARKVPRQVLERTVEKQMTEEQRQAERDAQSEQLAAIFKMMQDQEDKFGQTTIDEIKDQMKLYCG